MAPSDDNLGDLARRWLKTKKTELLTGNRRERESAEYENANVQRQIGDEVSHRGARAAIPAYREWDDRRLAAEAQREADELAAIHALPLAGVGLALRGEYTGTWSGQLPCRVSRDRLDDEEVEAAGGAAGEVLRVELVAPPDDVPVVAGAPLFGWRFAIPGFAGPGSYDLGARGEEIDRGDWGLDFSDYELTLGSTDEPSYWTPYSGGAAVEVADDERTLVVRMVVSGPGGDTDVSAHVNLPA